MAWALDLNWVQTAGFLNEEVDEDGIVQNVLQVRVRATAYRCKCNDSSWCPTVLDRAVLGVLSSSMRLYVTL